MRSSAAILAVAACGGAPVGPVHNEMVEHVPRVDFALFHGDAVDIAHTTDTGIVVDRTVKVPAKVTYMVWSGRDPVVWLDVPTDNFRMGPDGPEEAVRGGPHEAELGRIALTGYDKLPTPAWRHMKAPSADENASYVFEIPIRGLTAGAGGETWAAYCDVGFSADGMNICTDQVYARVAPTASDITDKDPERAQVWGFRGGMPDQPAPIGYTTAIVQQTRMMTYGGEREIPTLSCRGPNGSAVYPVGPDDSVGFGKPEWISLSPPIFVADQLYEGFTGYSNQRFFEGCAPSEQYSEAETGPHGTVWLTGKKLEVYWHGKRVGETQPGLLVFHAE